MHTHRNFTGIHRVLPCQTEVRPARVGDTSVPLRATPWPNRESPWACWCYNSIIWWSYGWETDHAGRAIMIPRNKPAWFRTGCVPSVLKNTTTGATSQWSPDQHGLYRFNTVLSCVATVWSRLALVFKPGRTVAEHRDSLNEVLLFEKNTLRYSFVLPNKSF